ncbi:MAG: RNA polymerase factor sigma-54 [Lachnospiraceae bacterium]|nr:RNA polymerase factor sigma-54 [Lachnospiraceae bacterium]
MATRLEQIQKQTVSQKMIQSVKILQMSSQELAEYMKEVALENPVIDFSDGETEDKDQERIKKLEWLASLDEQNRFYYQYDKDEAEEDTGMNNVSKPGLESLADSLRLQLMGKKHSEKEQRVFDYVMECLDSRGFFSVGISEVAKACKVTEDEASACVEVMRNLEPVGVCAANLQECILKQLADREDCGELELTIVREYMELLGKNQLHIIAKNLKVDVSEVTQAVKHIKECNPNPAQGFDDGELVRVVVPDITVVKFQDHFEILLNNYTCPVLHINKEYMNMLKTDCEKEVKDYLLGKVKQAEEIQESISRRSSTLLSLAQCIVDKQQNFFRTGEKNLRPFRLAEAAERIGCHESTVSRAIKDKYLQCCYGEYPLSFFFPKGLGEVDEGMAVLEVKQQLSQIIKEEDKQKPYSDSKLTELLNDKGIDISRRTVAKYREELNIPNCRGRKTY